MNSTIDRGYNINWTIKVKPGLESNAPSAAGVYTYRVLRRHRDQGYWETVITKGGHPALLGSIQIKSGKEILADAYAP
jgi:hypothetical protein